MVGNMAWRSLVRKGSSRHIVGLQVRSFETSLLVRGVNEGCDAPLTRGDREGLLHVRASTCFYILRLLHVRLFGADMSMWFLAESLMKRQSCLLGPS